MVALLAVVVAALVRTFTAPPPPSWWETHGRARAELSEGRAPEQPSAARDDDPSTDFPPLWLFGAVPIAFWAVFALAGTSVRHARRRRYQRTFHGLRLVEPIDREP